MKNVICLLLAIWLCLAVCGCAAAPDDPQPTAEPAAAPYFALKTLPEIGAFVSEEKKAYFFCGRRARNL